MTWEEFRAITWPGEFVVEFTDGQRRPLRRGEGVGWDPPDDDPEGRGSLSAYLPKRHPRNRDLLLKCYFDEVRAIYATDGTPIRESRSHSIGRSPGTSPGTAEL
jgi:hypothetical protein